MTQEIDFLDLEDDAQIAYRHRSGSSPGIIFCCGFHSDMNGNKATYLDSFAQDQDVAYTRFDYQGHGASSGQFADGTIGLWFRDALAVLDRVTSGPQIIVGSSMGAWIAMLLTKARPDRISGLILLAPAPDFPTALMLPSMPDNVKEVLYRDGVWDRPSEYADEDYPITLALIEESTRHNVLDGPPISFDGPVRIIHGDKDEVVPIDHALSIPSVLTANDVTVDLIEGGDHRLSKQDDLGVLARRLGEFLAEGARPERQV